MNSTIPYNMDGEFSTECRTIIRRLKTCDIDKIKKSPSLMLKFYPIRNPDNVNTVFDEVYTMVNESILKKTYKFRLFYFIDVFLSSTKVPAYVTAAYLKRLARLTLEAKPKSLVAILRIVNNLFVRHPLLVSLRDRVDEKARELETKSETCTLRQWLQADPFDVEERVNLKATNAMESCIWELMPLRYHDHPKVAKEACFLSEKNIPEIECDLSDLLI